MAYYPYLKDWGIYFQKSDGYENRYKAILSIYSFWTNRSLKEIILPEGCVLVGQVFGYYKFNDGETIVTANVKKIERIGITDKLSVATTATGTRYYLNDENRDRAMRKLIFLGKHELERLIYIKSKQIGPNLT